jgi:hypothetical protein
MQIVFDTIMTLPPQGEAAAFLEAFAPKIKRFSIFIPFLKYFWCDYKRWRN